MGLLSLLPILGLALWLRRALALQPGVSLLHSVAILLLVLFAGGLAGLLWWTALAIHVAGVGLLGAEAWRLSRAGASIRWPVPYLLLPFLAALFVLVHGDAEYYFYDEYAHWGVYIREMLAVDGFWPADTNAMHPRYPPGPPLWQYFFNAFLPPSEGRVYLGQFVLLVAPLMVLWDGLRWRQATWIAGLLVLCVIALSNFGLGVRSLYVDHVLGTWFGGSLLSFVLDRGQPLRRLGVYLAPLAVMALVKDSGIAFAASAAGIMGALALHRQWTNGVSRGVAVARSAGFVLALVVPAVLGILLWTWNRDAVGAPHDVQSVRGISSGLLGGAGDADDELNAEITRRFHEVFVHHQLSNDDLSWQFNAFTYPIRELFKDRFRLTTFWFLALFVAWWTAIVASSRTRDARWTWGILSAGLLASSLGYLASLYLSYRFAFGAKGLILSSYVRYAHTVVLPMLLASTAPLLPAFRASFGEAADARGNRFISWPGAAFAAILAALVVLERPFVLPSILPNPRHEVRGVLEPAADAVRETVGPARLWIYLPQDQPNEFIGRLLTYLVTPTPAVVNREASFFDQPPEAIAEAWKNAEYVWIVAPPGDAAKQRLTELSGRPVANGLFRVRRDGAGSLGLEPVGAEATP